MPWACGASLGCHSRVRAVVLELKLRCVSVIGLKLIVTSAMQGVVFFAMLLAVAVGAAEPSEDLKPLGATICVLLGPCGILPSHARALPMAGFSSASPATPAHSRRQTLRSCVCVQSPNPHGMFRRQQPQRRAWAGVVLRGRAGHSTCGPSAACRSMRPRHYRVTFYAVVGWWS